MWAFQLQAPGRLTRVEVPTLTEDDLGDDEVLVAYEAGSVCGSDLPGFAGHPSALVHPPRAPGFPFHEVVGTVVASRSPGLEPGSRVVGWADRMRGLAERFVSRGDSVALVDERLTAAEATVVQPLCCVVYALDQVGDVAGREAAVVGLGTLGLLFTHVLADRGATVTGVDPVDRTDVAAAFGITRLVTEPSRTWVTALAEGPDAARPEVVVEAVGHQVGTVSDAVHAVRDRGRVYAFGVPDEEVYPVPFERLFRKAVTLTGGVTRDRRRSLERAQDYLLAHRELPASYLTHRFAVDDAQRAFELAAVPAPGRLKVLLEAAPGAGQ